MSLSVVSSGAITNEWTKTSSGYWEEPFWSLGTLPSAGQDVAFRNPGWKALAIGTNTTANYPASLTVNNLIIDGPTNSANQLLLNWAGLAVPLVVRENLIVGTNGSIACHSSSLIASNVLLRGPASFSDQSRAALDQLTFRWGGALNINNAHFASSNLVFLASGVVTQSAGVAMFSMIDTDNQWGVFFPPEPAYHLLGGVLMSGVAHIGEYDLSGATDCTIFQSGGVHTNGTMTLWGGQRRFQQINSAGHYVLSGGLLVSGDTRVYAGTMEQSGGTNLTGELSIDGGGYFTLAGGHLVTSNTSIDTVDCLRGVFSQSGGSHTIQNRLLLSPTVSYSLSAGTLSAPTIEIDPGAGLGIGGGTVSNPGTVILRRGAISVQGQPQQFGKLQVLDGIGYGCGSDPDPRATLRVGFSNAVVLRFADSRDLPWSGSLYIRNWSTNDSGHGPDRIFVGANSQALTSDQLRQIIFIRPSGLPSDYSAALTASGELVPAAVHDFDYVLTNGAVTITRYTGPGGNITVPGTIENLHVTTIGDRAFNPREFNEISILTSVTLPDSVTNIGEQAFHYCKGLTNINLGNGVIRIGDDAFGDCDNLSAITLGASVQDIGQRIFESSHNVAAINVHPDNPFLSSVDGVLFDKSQARLIQFPLGKAGVYAIPQTVRSIEEAAFSACYSLSNVIFSASVTNIGAGAFEFCVGLTNLTMPEGLRSIGDFAFFHCIGLTNITLPDSLTSVGARVFEQSALIRAEIGRGITSFGGWHFFAYCEHLAGVYFRGDAPEVISDFQNSYPTIYYLPGTVGWGPTFAGRPTALWQLPKPLILKFGPSFGARTNHFGFVISWATNASVIVEASSDPNNSSWRSVSTNTLTSGSSYFSDVRWRDDTNRFYRLRSP